MGLMPASKTIKSKQVYTLDEVFELLVKDGKLPSEPYRHSVLGRKSIQVPGTSQHVVDISVSRNKPKIVVQEAPKPSAGSIALDIVTDGWSSMVGRQVTDIKDIVLQVAAEVERLFA
jgi:hypothetical protein